jgi:hypothetical protein
MFRFQVPRSRKSAVFPLEELGRDRPSTIVIEAPKSISKLVDVAGHSGKEENHLSIGDRYKTVFAEDISEPIDEPGQENQGR